MPKGPLLQYTDNLYDIFDDIGDRISDKLMTIESDPMLDNEIGIELVDKSPQDWSFNVKIDGEFRPMRVNQFIKFFLGDEFTPKEIQMFTNKYNLLKSEKNKNLIKIDVPKFVWNPKDVRSTFISLVTETYPHGHEEEVVPYIINAGLTKDEFGNYFKIIGSSETMFTSHLDTADRKKSTVVLCVEKENDQEFLTSDGSTILGSDDKAGVTVMLYMIAHNVPGIYYFFIGEERGGIGSGSLSSTFEEKEHLKNIKRCVSFDRKNYHSIITRQIGVECCSDEFAQALADQYNSKGMELSIDPTGIYTDSASFIDQIPECTNVSVGYFNEHTTKERQNITYLENLAKSSVQVKWEELPTIRKIGIDDDILLQYSDFIKDFKSAQFNMYSKIVTEMNRTFVKIEMYDCDIEMIQDDLLNLSTLFYENNMDPYLTFNQEFIYIELVDKNLSKSKKYIDDFNVFESSEDWSDEENDDYLNNELEDDDVDPNMKELAYWVRQMFKSNKIYTYVDVEKSNLVIYTFLNKEEKIGKLINVFDVVSKTKNELLVYYDVEVELYENEKEYPVLKFDFIWNEEIGRL